MTRYALLVASIVSLHFAERGYSQAPSPPPPSIASLGTCRLMSGAIIQNCRIAYRTFGRLNAARSNAVLIPTWLLGRSEDWIPLLGATALVDTTRLFTILVDAFGNGRSSSPSNTDPSARAAFNDLTIADMVEAQRRFVVEHLKLPHLHAVVGISMGGMQAFEWAVRYPTFMDVVIPIAGSPQLGAFDQTLWTTLLSEIDNGRARGVPADTIWMQIARVGELFLRTPRGVNEAGPKSVASDIREFAATFRQKWNLEDYASQLRAARRHDVAARFGGNLSRAAAQVRARMLVIYSWDDHMVTPGTAAAFAKMVRADTLSVPSTCGHVASGCESARVNPVVRRFLAR